VRTKNLIALGASIALVLVLVLTGCAQTTGGGGGAPAGKAQEPTYKALSATGIFIPVETKALGPRLTTVVGKTLYICQGEADPVIMPAVNKMMRVKYPNTKFIYYDRSDFGPNVPGTGGVTTSTRLPEDPDILKKVDGVVRGIGW
jgi:hypothetical protein